MSINRRKEPRYRMIQRGRVIMHDGYTSFDCVLLDLSATGARIKLEPWIGFPDVFELRIPNKPPRKARICHIGHDSAGIRFIDEPS